MTKLTFITGSLRSGSSSRAVASALMDEIGSKATTDFAEIGQLPHYNSDLENVSEVETFKAAIETSDGIIIVTPEYNYSIPGVLKNALDWASRPGFDSVFKDKPVFIVTTSAGALGGVRAQASLKYTLSGLLAKTFSCQEVAIPLAPKKVIDGKFNWDEGMPFINTHLTAFLDSLV